MSRIQRVIREIHQMDTYTQQHTFLSRVSPGVKLLVTVFFLIMMTSFGKYNLSGLLGMSIYLIIVYQLGDISLKGMFLRVKEVLIILFLLGAANLFMDREVIAHWGQIPVTGGMLSCFTLYGKGVFAILSSYALVATTGMENICYVLQSIHMPRVIVVCVLLTYRYLIQFAKEADRVSLAYAMRAPGQKGIHMKAWGSMVGNMLLRSVDRAETVYESMQLRGFQGNIRLQRKTHIQMPLSVIYGFAMIILTAVLRFVPVFELIGRLVV